MPAFPRYAIYYVPARDSTLWRFGAETLGYDAFSGSDVPFPHELTTSFADWSEITADPRIYGFHATLKPPFALAEGVEESRLIGACRTFSAQPREIPEITLAAAAISGFTALAPKDATSALMELARDVVQAFDPFRAPLAAEDRARRDPDKLTPRQSEYLDRWGYPHVMDEFRFHMTLTGRLAPERGASARAILSQRFRETGLAVVLIDRIALFYQEEAKARFRIIGEFPLTAVR